MSGSDLQVELRPSQIAGLATLIAEITGQESTGRPWLAPALLFSGAEAQLDMPIPAADEMLVQDYQAIDFHRALPVGAALNARATRHDMGPTTEFDFVLGDVLGDAISLKTALRLVPRQDLAALKPTRFVAAQLADPAGQARGLVISQAQVDRYVELSGDRNPIHSDPGLARALGLRAPIVPGLLLLATLQPFVDTTPAMLKCRFMAPLCVDEAYGVAVMERGPGRLRGCLYAGEDRALAIADLQARA